MKKRPSLIAFLVFFPLVLSVFFSFPPSALAEEGACIEMFYFYGRGCMHCAQVRNWLKGVEEDFPSLEVTEKEIYFDDENMDLVKRFERRLNFETEKVPVVIVGEDYFVGPDKGDRETILESIEEAKRKGPSSPLALLQDEDKRQGGQCDVLQRITLPAVLTAAALDSINPCAFAVLVLLLGTLLVAKRKEKILRAGLAFSAAIFISYFLMGYGLYSAIRAMNVVSSFYLGVSALAILAGLINLKSYFFPDSSLQLEVPASWKPKVEKMVKGITSAPGAFLIGFGVSLLLLPCTSGPYIAILGLLSKSTINLYATGMLLIYNMVFIVPMIVITAAVHFGFLTTAKVESWRQQRMGLMRLSTGLLMLALGVMMLVSSQLGWI